MTRLFTLLALLIWATPLFAQQLPPGADPQNTILIDTKYGRIAIKLRNDIAPKHAERIEQNPTALIPLFAGGTQLEDRPDTTRILRYADGLSLCVGRAFGLRHQSQ